LSEANFDEVTRMSQHLFVFRQQLHRSLLVRTEVGGASCLLLHCRGHTFSHTRE
jgi:hypothetical protein